MLHFACLSSGRGPFEGMSREPARAVDLSGERGHVGGCKDISLFCYEKIYVC